MEQRRKGQLLSSSPARGATRQGRLDHFLYNDQRPASRNGRADQFLYHDQGPSSYNVNSYYEQSEGARYLNPDLNGPSRFENLENSRAELLRKLDELKDHLSRSCQVTDDEPRRRMISPAATYLRNHTAYVEEGLTTSSHGVNKQPFDHGAPYSHGYSSSLRDSHSRRRYPHEGSSYADSYGHPQSRYLHQPYHEPRHGYGGNVNYPNENFHNRTCSCVHCFDKNWDLPANVDPLCLYNQRSPHVLSNPSYDHHLYSTEHGLYGYQSGGYNLHTSRPQPSITRDSTELDFENDGFHQSLPRKVEEVHRNRHMMHPVAGGAPFIACSSCFELLRLPRKHISSAKDHQKLKCGACSSIILLELRNKAPGVPLAAGSFDHVVTEMGDSSSLVVNENLADTHACSDSNDDSLPKVSLEDKKSNSDECEKHALEDKKSNSDECEKQADPLSSASSLSNDKQMPDSLTSEKHHSSSAELHVTEVESIPLPILPTEENPDHCSANIVVSQPDNGKIGMKSEFDNSVSWQHSVRDSAVSTDMSSKEFPKSFISQDTWDESKEQRVRDDKGAESSSEILDDSRSGDFRKLPQNVEFGTSQVFINGHLIPEHLVQKAELLAGPIQPGEYWYDIHAGFWGVMDFPCLGIIMPNIEEFNYPMPEDCAAGNTEVFVNGRELHQKDLDLLAGRGLPRTRGGSYFVKISGEVVDENTGEELDSIGKLAPTVERAKHGSGMKVPRFISRSQS